jgi:hypothetical protein
LRCQRRALYVQALVGVPLLKGLGPGCGLAAYEQGYGFGDYGHASRAVVTSDQEICRHAAERQITRVLVLESTTDPTRNRLLACGREPPEPAAS